MWGVYNTRVFSHNPTLRCPICCQFAINGHMAGSCPFVSCLRLGRHNRALLKISGTHAIRALKMLILPLLDS
jgi:hypothetical protein